MSTLPIHLFLSWSLLEAMSTGCLVIASKTPPIEEFVNDTNGILIPFFGVKELADRVIEALSHPRKFKKLRMNARKTIVENFDLHTICLPKLVRYIGLESHAPL